MKLKGKDRDELKTIIKEALKEALMELVREGVLEVKVTEKLAEPTLIETEPTEPTSSTLIETEPTTLIETETEPVETIKDEPAEPTPSTLIETVTKPAENVTEPIKVETEPADNTTLIETETITVPTETVTEPADNTTLIDLEPLKTFILNAPIDQVNDFILNSDELFGWLHGAGIYPDILKDRETLWGLIKDAVELGYLKLQVSVNFFPDPDDDPAGWVVGAGKEKDATFHWDECRQGIREGYLTLRRYNDWLTPHDFLNLLLHIKDHSARQRFIFDLAVIETAPELANPATLKHLERFKLDYPTPPPCREEPISVIVDRITGRWGRECGLGDEERVDRVLTHLNANFKESPPDELSNEPDDDEPNDDEPNDDPPFLNLLFSPDCDDSDNEVTQARKALKQLLLELATAILPEDWAELPLDELRRHCKPLLKLVQEDAKLRELAIKAKWLEPSH
jgi:hypothetical protein